MKIKYVVLCVLGAALPYWFFVPWVAKNGLNMNLFFHELFASRIGGFFAMDVLVSAIVLIGFIFNESATLGLRSQWLPVIATLTVGVSLGLPLFLGLRESALAQRGGKPQPSRADTT